MSDEQSMEDRVYGPPRTQRVEPPSEGPQPEPTEEPAFEDAPAPEPEPRKEFDPRHRNALTGLLFLGHLEDEFEYLGHKFVVRNMRFGEEIEAGMLIKDALGTRVEIKAWSAAVAAAGIVSVDGQPLIVPLVAAQEPTHREKYQAVLKWYEPIISEVYRRVMALGDQAREVMEAMGEAEGQGR